MADNKMQGKADTLRTFVAAKGLSIKEEKEIVAKEGKDALKSYAKLHFQTTKAILQEESK